MNNCCNRHSCVAAGWTLLAPGKMWGSKRLGPAPAHHYWRGQSSLLWARVCCQRRISPETMYTSDFQFTQYTECVLDPAVPQCQMSSSSSQQCCGLGSYWHRLKLSPSCSTACTYWAGRTLKRELGWVEVYGQWLYFHCASVCSTFLYYSDRISFPERIERHINAAAAYCA